MRVTAIDRQASSERRLAGGSPFGEGTQHDDVLPAQGGPGPPPRRRGERPSRPPGPPASWAAATCGPAGRIRNARRRPSRARDRSLVTPTLKDQRFIMDWCCQRWRSQTQAS
jgi:hypothetical protein